MPKFLDAPSWYDSDGNKRTIVTTMRIGVSNTGSGCYCNVPVISEGSVNLDGIPEQPLYTLPFLSGTQSVGGIPYWSGTQNGYRVMGQGTSGQVLMSDGSNAPKWSKLYVHNVYINGTADGGIAAYAYMTVVSSDSEEYTTAAQVYAKFPGYQHIVMTTGKIASESTYGVIVGSFLSNNTIGMRYIKIGTPNGTPNIIYIAPSSISDRVCSIT